MDAVLFSPCCTSATASATGHISDAPLAPEHVFDTQLVIDSIVPAYPFSHHRC